MAGVNIANQGLTFVDALPEVTETLNMKAIARTLPKKYNWTGTNIEFKVHVGRNNSVGYTEDAGSFNPAGKQTHIPAKATRKFITGAIQVSDGGMATARGSKNVAKDLNTVEIQGLMNDILKFENYHFFLDGTGTVTTLQDNRLATLDTAIEVYDSRGLWDGCTVEVRDTSSSDALLGYVTVDTVNQDLSTDGYPTFEAAAALTGADAGDKLVRKGSWGRAITGLDKLIGDSGVFQAINTATYPTYTSMVLDSSSNRALTPTLLRQALAGIKQKAGNDRPAQGLDVLCSNWQLIEVEELYEGQVRMTPESTSGGAAVASFMSTFGKVNFRPDSSAPYGKIFLCDFSKIFRATQQPLSWRRGNDGNILQPSQNALVYVATAVEISDLFIRERHTSGKITHLTETQANPFG